jgi:hypothetical protein
MICQMLPLKQEINDRNLIKEDLLKMELIEEAFMISHQVMINL